LPEVFPNIEYDEDGICSVCHEWDRKWVDNPKKDSGKKSDEEFLQLVEKIKVEKL